MRRWVRRTQTGDRGEIGDLPEGIPFWGEICVGEHCLGSTCPDDEACFLTRLRQRAAAADLLIVNHHLFFAALALRH